MAKKMRKLLALTLVLALAAGQLLLPAAAETTTTPIENGTKTVTTTTEGNTTTVTTTVSTADPATGNTYDSTNTTTTTTSTDSGTYSNTTSTDSNWTTVTDTTQSPVTTGDGSTTTTTGSASTTNTTGSESGHESDSYNIYTGVETISGGTQGSESSQTETTITTTTTNGDTLIGTSTIVDADQNDALPNTSDPGADLNDEDSWDYGDVTTEQDWTGSGIVEGKEPDPSTGKTVGSATSDATPDAPGATLELAPNGQWVQEKINITLSDVSDGKYDLKNYDSEEYTIETHTDDKGNVTGWTVTKRTESKPKATTSTPVTPAAGSGWTQVGTTVTVVGTDAALEQKASNTAGEKLADNKTQYVTKIYEDGKFVGYEIRTVTVDDSDSAPVTTDSTRPTEESSGTLAQAQGYLLPTKPQAGSTTAEDGTKTDVVVNELKENGVLVGYTVVTSITDAEGNPVSTETRNVLGTTVTAPSQENSGFVLPERPQESKSTDKYGDVTSVTVTDLIENGVHVGYTIVTQVTSAGGEAVRTEKRNIYGTTSSTQVDVVKDPLTEETTTHTKVTTTEVEKVYITDNTRNMEQTQTYTQNYDTTILTEKDTYQLVDTADGMYFLYKGKMYAVTGTSTTDFKATLSPDMDLVNAPGWDTDLYRKNTADNGRYSGYEEENIKSSMYENGYEYLIVGNGAASELGVRRYKEENGTESVGTITNHQFALRDRDGNLFYVYCADMSTSVQTGANYNMENVEDATYYQGADAVSHIQTVAVNGFWATESGAGSLQAVRDLLEKYGYQDAADNITEGEALSATQAAIWTFGNNDSDRWIDGSNPVSGSTHADTLYKLLISDKLMKDTSAKRATTTDILNKNDVMGGSITVHGVATHADGTEKTLDGGTVYNTDVSFSLSVTKSDLTGNLTVTLTQGGRTVDTINLATADSNILGKILSGGKEVGTSITFRGVELVEGVEFNISLDGTQELKEGVYLYTAKGGYTAAQTFVGVASGTNTVDVDMKMVFTATDPEVKNTYKATETHRNDTEVFTKVNSRQDTARVTKTENSGNVLTQKTHNVNIYGDITTTETETEHTKENREWESYWKYLLQIINGDDGDEDGKKKGTTILDEEVPLADAPKTGDISGLWAAVSLISLGGAAMLSVKRKEEE